MDFWHELAVACCLMLVLEGVIPFLAPRRWRNMVTMIADINNAHIRIMGLLSMLVGTIILYLIN